MTFFRLLPKNLEARHLLNLLFSMGHETHFRILSYRDICYREHIHDYSFC